MTFLTRFEAKHYRGIGGLCLEHLSQANLVTGVNGIGKTALLEAMWLFTGRYNPVLLWNANVQRSTVPVLDPVVKLAGGKLELHGVENEVSHRLECSFERVAEITRPVAIANAPELNLAQLPVAGRIVTRLDGEPVSGNVRGLQHTPWGTVAHENPEPPMTRPNCVIEGTTFPIDATGEFLQRYSRMVRENHKKKLTDAINLMLPKVADVEILADETGAPYLSAATSDGVQRPLHHLGGGVIRLSRLLLSFFSSRDGLLLADEMENGIHYSALEEVWSSARRWMREWSVQLVATTHSAECIEAAMAVFADAPEDLAIHHLFMNEETGRVEAATFTGEALKGARDLGLEVR